jgi:CheY-like chemotaxis protein
LYKRLTGRPGPPHAAVVARGWLYYSLVNKQQHQHRVLVVDDDEDTRSGLAELLRLDGYRVAEAGDGQEALERLHEQERPCLVLLDLQMPRTSGWEFRALQERDREIADIPVVVLSAQEGAELQVKRLRLAGFLAKPLDFDLLIETIQRTCPLAA